MRPRRKICLLSIDSITYDDKFILFDVEPGINITFRSLYFGQLSVRGICDSRERASWGLAVKVKISKW